MNRTRKGGLWKLFRKNTKTFLNVTFGMIPDSVHQLLAGIICFHKILVRTLLNSDVRPVCGQVRTIRVKVEEARSSLQAAKSKGRVIDALMELKRAGRLPGIHGRLVRRHAKLPQNHENPHVLHQNIKF